MPDEAGSPEAQNATDPTSGSTEEPVEPVHADSTLPPSAALASSSMPSRPRFGHSSHDASSDVGEALASDSSGTSSGQPEGIDHEWESELSTQRVAIERRRVEGQVRKLLEERDPKRKRKLAGTHRWHELEEDILSWRFSGRFDETVLQRLSELIARRHFLSRHLKFLASTRPTWNS